ALGIVVDDAIVAGENIYDYRSEGKGFSWAATHGARDVAVPVSFSILTNVVAFLPIYFMPGTLGKVWNAIPVVVITVFLISWVESLLILPSHLAHARAEPANRLTAVLHRGRERFNGLVLRAIAGIYGPVLAWCLRWRFVVVAAGVAVFTATAGYVWSGRIGMILMARVESDSAVVTATLPLGSPLSRAEAVGAHLVAAAQRVAAANGGERLVEGIRTEIDENQVEVTAYLTDPAVRPLSTSGMTRLWRVEVGVLPGVQSGRFESDRGGPGSGAALRVELSHRDIGVLDRAGTDLAERLSEFPNVKDIDDGYTPGKQQLTFRLLPEGQGLGLTPQEVARQVRSAFFGATALRQQRGRNEVTVRVRLPEAERNSEYGVEELLLSTPAGTFVPLGQVAAVERGRAYTSISRLEGRRTVTVTADVEPIGDVSMVRASLDRSILPRLAQDHPGLSYRYVGRQASMTESIQSLLKGFGLAMLAIYFLLAIPFRSYSQPLIVMAAIPFGMAGAVYGHVLMGYNLSLMSMMGAVALSGVVVNDSLVLIDYANRRRREGDGDVEAMYTAGLRRFRPVILTTLTTFGGLAPMIFETSRQARFMIPMALSLGYGILFATLVTLVFVPCLYVIVEDVLSLLRGPQSTGGEVVTAVSTPR
ncbi:MAG TPA: efflux RND transporter permease subunit, partial [Deferrisomatales bacterium]|nr:efflux RND transporter permease subunit [Deferrisomatales bacterium]